MDSNINVSIIVPVYNGEKFVDSCIKSLTEQTYPKELFEIIMVDNNSTDDGMNIAKKYNVKIITEEKRSSYAARNAGIKIAKGSIIGFTDVDCIVSNDWIENAVKQIKDNDDTSLFSGSIEFFADTKETIWGTYDKNRFLKQEHISKSGSATTANLFTKREVLNDIGPFDGNLISGGDGEWTNRARNAGYKLKYCSEIKVYHPIRNQFKEVANKCLRIGFGKGQYFRKQKRWLRMIFPNYLVSTIKILPKSVFNGEGRLPFKLFLLFKLMLVEIMLSTINYVGSLKGFITLDGREKEV